MKKTLTFILLISVITAAQAQKKKVVKKTTPISKALTKAVDSAKSVEPITVAKDTAATVKPSAETPVSTATNTSISNNNTSTSSTVAKGLGILNGVLNNGSGEGGSLSSLTNGDIVNGLKEALSKGAQKSSDKLSVTDGFFANAALKILMPPEAQKVEQKLRALGFGAQVDEAVLSMNRAAEDAAKSAAPIFINAITSISISDALGILKGNDTAATGYLRGKTLSSLTEAFRPVIENSLQKVGATKYWTTLFTTYNKLPLVSKINPDLSSFVTERATAGIFTQLGQEEAEIRKNPLARTSELLQKVFGSK
jgi:hypothetical protein